MVRFDACMSCIYKFWLSAGFCSQCWILLERFNQVDKFNQRKKQIFESRGKELHILAIVFKQNFFFFLNIS